MHLENVHAKLNNSPRELDASLIMSRGTIYLSGGGGGGGPATNHVQEVRFANWRPTVGACLLHGITNTQLIGL